MSTIIAPQVKLKRIVRVEKNCAENEIIKRLYIDDMWLDDLGDPSIESFLNAIDRYERFTGSRSY